jgi:hypothetical protein
VERKRERDNTSYPRLSPHGAPEKTASRENGERSPIRSSPRPKSATAVALVAILDRNSFIKYRY